MRMGVANDIPLRLRGTSRSYEENKIVDWLASGARPEHGTYAPHNYYVGKYEGAQWSNVQLGNATRDSDIQSTTSIDDSVSVSDSSHESLSSDSSSQTGSTSATDPTDYSDEEQIHPKEGLTPATYLDASYTAQDFKASSTHYSLHSDLAKASFLARVRVQDAPKHNSVNDVNQSQRRQPNARRTSCSANSQSQPCKLKRDTDCTDQFVTMLIVFATRLITAIWPLSACPPMMTSCFNGAGVLPLQVFIQETLKRSRTSYSTLQVALYYLILLKVQLGKRDCPTDSVESTAERKHCRAMQCGRRMFLSALMLASKYLQDRNYSARAWSKISGLRSNEINENEREYLSLIDYSLHVPKDTFDNWNKIVISLSKLSKEAPQCRASLGDSDRDLDNSDGGITGSNLSFLASSEDTFTIEWWNGIIQKLTPGVIKDVQLTENFLSTHVPFFKDLALLKQVGKSEDESREFDVMPTIMDVNFSDSLKTRADASSRSSTPQTPTQMSPARSAIPMQPRLRNLPTPQTTPKLAEATTERGLSTPQSLRCSASMEVLRNMRRQCLMNASLDRCPPPKPQGCDSQSVRSSIRPAVTSRGSYSRSATPSTSSPMSAASVSSPYHPRSRSSSISSISSCSSSISSNIPQLQALSVRRSESPLPRASTAPSVDSTLLPGQSKNNPFVTKFVDEGYGSGEEPLSKLSREPETSSEFAAIRILMSLSTTETPSQSVTPTPQNYREIYHSAPSVERRGHKRNHSGTDSQLQSHVKSLLWQDVMNVHSDSPGRSGVNPSKQWQQPTKTWAEAKRALPNAMDTKRVAYCALQQHASAPDLATRYLKDVRVSAAS